MALAKWICFLEVEQFSSEEALSEIRLVCLNLQGNVESPTALGSFAIDPKSSANVSTDQETLPIVYYIEAQQRSWTLELEQYRETDWYRIGRVISSD